MDDLFLTNGPSHLYFSFNLRPKMRDDRERSAGSLGGIT
jgi:hypothetical protein